jgi:hypothetical protein
VCVPGCSLASAYVCVCACVCAHIFVCVCLTCESCVRMSVHEQLCVRVLRVLRVYVCWWLCGLHGCVRVVARSARS